MAVFTKKPFGIIYLDRNSFTYFTEANKPLTFTYPSSSVSELEVINENLFIKEAGQFIQSNKLSSAVLMFILSSDILYVKDFIDEPVNKPVDQNKSNQIQNQNQNQNPVQPTQTVSTVKQAEETENTDKDLDLNLKTEEAHQDTPALSPQEQRTVALEERARQIQSFIEIVPLEEVASKTYKIEKGIRVIATNKKLYEMMINTFTKQGFIVDSVVPITVIGKEFIGETGMNQDAVLRILRKFEIVRQNSLLEENSYALSREALEPHHIKMTTKVTTKREYVLIAVFGCLLLLLGFMVYTTVIVPMQQKKVKPVTKKVQVIPSVIPTVIPTTEPVASSSAETASASALFNKALVRIQIVGGTELQTNLLKQDLVNNGYTNTITKPNNTPATGKALVIFKPTLIETAKEDLLTRVKTNFLNVSVQQNTITDADVVISL